MTISSPLATNQTISSSSGYGSLQLFFFEEDREGEGKGEREGGAFSSSAIKVCLNASPMEGKACRRINNSSLLLLLLLDRPPGDTVHSQEMRNLRPELKVQSALEKPQGFPQELPREHPPPGGEKDTPNWPLPPLSPPHLQTEKPLAWHAPLKKIGGHLLIIPPLPKKGEDAISHDVPFLARCNNCSSDNIF